MLNFWIVVAVMISVPIVILLRILISPKPGIYKSKAPIDVMVYKSRAEELETEIESGILNNEHLAEAHDDLKRNLLHEIEHQQSVDATNILKRDWWTAGSVTILLPVIAISIYLVLG
ncbi:MAG: c-type cytochrome biogenesis protein CcmI, partial [Candidatus Dadabacteria bacterium]|nr:c-type cytochrome biogenesis protein CcmI [Candidatus Dadabacteria bacterium]